MYPSNGYSEWPFILSIFCVSSSMAVGTAKRIADRSQGPALYQNHDNNHKTGKAPKSKRICSFWLSGRCNRNPCRFMHAELPRSNTYRRSSKQSSHKADEHIMKQSGYVAEKHIPSSMYCHIPEQSSHEEGKQIVKQTFCKAEQRPDKSLKVHHAHQSPSSPTSGTVANGRIDERPPKAPDAVCNFRPSGSCVNDECHFLHSWSHCNEITQLAKLREHNKDVVGVAFLQGSDKLLSASKDGRVCVWDARTGGCIQRYNLGGEVGAFICEGPWVFVGLQNSIKSWNIQSNAEYDLTGPAGQVHALAVASDRLFAGVQDGVILAWEVSSGVNPFQLRASLQGHTKAVVSFVVGASWLYSGSLDQTIRVWDSSTLECVHTLNGHTDAVTSLLCWDRFLLSSSLDKTIKVWMATEDGDIEVTHTHYEDHGVLSLFGMHDRDVNPVLFCACNDKSVRLYNLPNFTERGRLFSEREVRTIQLGPGGLFFSGDAAGTISVWKWLTSSDSCSLTDGASGEIKRDLERCMATCIEV